MQELPVNRWGIILLPFLFLFVFSMPTSIAGMELATFFIVLLVSFLWLASFKIKTIFIPVFPDKGLLISMFAFWMCLVISALADSSGHRSFMDFFIEGRFILLIVFGYIAISMQSDKNKKLLIWTLFFVSVVVASFAVWQSESFYILRDWHFIKRSYGRPFRVNAFFSNTMTYSYVFSLIFIYFYGTLLTKKRSLTSRLLLILGLLVIGASIVLTYTRGAWFSVLVSVFISMIYLRGRFSYIFGGLIFLVTTSIVYLFPGYLKRLFDVLEKGSSLDVRMEIWRAAIDIFSNNIWVGVGFRNFQNLVGDWYLNATNIKYAFIGHAHNGFLEVLVGIGVLGAIVYLAMHCRIFNTVRSLGKWAKNDRALLLPGFLLISVFHLSCLTESIILDYEIVYAFSMLFLLALFFPQIYGAKANRK